MAAEVVNRRSRLTSVKRVKAIGPSVRCHQRLAEARWTWSACNRASHTFTSGKLNKVVDLLIGEVERPAAGGGDNGRIEAEAPARPDGFCLRDGTPVWKVIPSMETCARDRSNPRIVDDFLSTTPIRK